MGNPTNWLNVEQWVIIIVGLVFNVSKTNIKVLS